MKLSPLYEDNKSLHDQLFVNDRPFTKKIRHHSNGMDILFSYHYKDRTQKYKFKIELIENNRDDMGVIVSDDKPDKLVVRIYSNNLKYLYNLQFTIFDRFEKHENVINVDNARSLFADIGNKTFNHIKDDQYNW